MITNYNGANISWANRRVCTPNVVIGEILYRPGGYCGPRLQRDYELVTIHSGASTVMIDEVPCELTVGSVYRFLPGHREHFRFSSDRETHHSWCSVNPRLLPKALRLRLAQAAFAITCSETFAHLLRAAYALRSPRSEAASQTIDRLGLCLCAEFLRVAEEAVSGPGPNEPVSKALRFMEDHLSDADCLVGAHKASGMCRNALIYKFHDELNTTPSRYLWKLRTERGIAMLGETGHTVSEIAYKCGFKNPFHFSRLVKQTQGAPPRQIRRASWSIGQGA